MRFTSRGGLVAGGPGRTRDDCGCGPGEFLVDLQDLADEAVLAVGGLGARAVLEFQAVLVDPLVRGFQGGHELLRAPTTKMTLAAPHA